MNNVFELSFAQAYLIFQVTAGFISIVGLAIGIFSVALPAQSIGLYQWIMKRINWTVTPINAALELKNTRRLSLWLTLLSVTLAANIFFKFFA